MSDITTVILYSLLMAGVTGLGVVPLAVSKSIPAWVTSLASALASGLLLAAAFQLINEGTVDDAATTTAGMVMGLVLITISRRWLERWAPPDIGQLAKTDARGAAVLIGVMTVHSFPEGIAVGLALGKSLHFGLLISLAIALHNIPEGLAIGLVLVPRGVKTWKAGLWSIFSSLPQPLMAVPAFLLASAFEPFLPIGLGLAAGAMIWMIGAEVLPESCGKASSRSIGVALTLGVVLMLVVESFN